MQDCTDKKRNTCRTLLLVANRHLFLSSSQKVPAAAYHTDQHLSAAYSRRASQGDLACQQWAAVSGRITPAGQALAAPCALFMCGALPLRNYHHTGQLPASLFGRCSTVGTWAPWASAQKTNSSKPSSEKAPLCAPLFIVAAVLCRLHPPPLHHFAQQIRHARRAVSQRGNICAGAGTQRVRCSVGGAWRQAHSAPATIHYSTHPPPHLLPALPSCGPPPGAAESDGS